MKIDNVDRTVQEMLTDGAIYTFDYTVVAPASSRLASRVAYTTAIPNSLRWLSSC